MWNWETECWGEANVAQFHQFEEQLVNQCLQTPVNEEVKKMAPQTAPLRLQQPMVRTFAQMPVYQTYPYGFGSHAVRFYGKRMAEDTIPAQELMNARYLTKRLVKLTSIF